MSPGGTDNEGSTKQNILNVGYVYLVLAPFLVGTGVEASYYLRHFPVYFGQGLRYGIGALILLVVARKELKGLSAVSIRDWLRIGLLSATGLYGFSIGMVEAVRSSSPTAVGVVIGCAPILIAVVSEASNRKLPSRQVLIGAVVVASSTAVVQGVGEVHVDGLLWSLLALACDSLYSVLSAPLVPKTGASLLAFVTNAFAAIALVLTQIVLAPIASMSLTPRIGAAIVYLGVFVSAVAFIFWYKGISVIPVQLAGLFVGFIPIGSLIAQALLGGRVVSGAEMLGTAGVIVGITVGVVPKTYVARLLRHLRYE